MVATRPVMLVADLQDGPGQDLSASRRAKPFTAQGLGNLRIRGALGPQLPGAFNHGVVASDLALVQDRRDDDPLRDMATDPDNLDFYPSGGQTVRRIDVLVTAPGQVGAVAGLRDLLLIVCLQTLLVALALRQHLVQR